MLRSLAVGAAAWCLLCSASAMAQLAAGDIAFVAYNSDGSNDFAWVALRRIPACTEIHFTDMSVSNRGFRLSEHFNSTDHGPLTWRHTNAVEAGSVVRWLGGAPGAWSTGQATGGAPNLSAEGDQLIAYCGVIVSNTAFTAPWIGDAAGATLLHAINFANGGWDNVTGGNANRSFVPPGLSTNAGTAVHVSNKDNGYYSGTTRGAAETLLAAIADPSNWTTADSLFEGFYWSGATAFHVNPGGTVLSVR